MINRRLRKIFDILNQSKEKIKGDCLALSTGVSSRTIRNDIKELNSILRDAGAEIESEVGQGYFLKINNKPIYEGFLNSLEYLELNPNSRNIIPSDPKDRELYIINKLLLRALNKEEKFDLFDLEKELFISYSTLKKDLRLVNKVLKKYGLKISITKTYGVRIIGEEDKIRYCISDCIFNDKTKTKKERQEFIEILFSANEVKIVKEILLENIKKYNLKLTDISFNNIVNHTLIMLERFKSKKVVKYPIEEIRTFTLTDEFRCAQEVILQLKESMNIDLGDEVYYLTQHLITSQRFLIDDINNKYVYKPEIENILSVINNKTHIDLSDDKQLINGLAMHLNSALQRLRFDMNIRNEFLDSIKNSYPLAFELAVIAGEIIEKKFNLKAKESEIGFLAMHFGASLERKGLNKNRKRKKVVIVCIAGVATAMLLKEKIQNNLNNKVEVVKTCSMNDVSQELIDSVDILLTTVELENFSSPKIKKIKLFLEEKDIDQLEKMIDDTERYSNEIDYKQIFKPELFFYNIDFKDKNSVLEFMTDKMLENGYISEVVKESIFKREEMATTELGGLVAIPHALSNNSTQAIVSIMILRKPIVWDKERVQVVLLFSIPKSKYDIWEVVFKKLYNYLIAQQGVMKLIKNRNYEEFISELNKTHQ